MKPWPLLRALAICAAAHGAAVASGESPGQTPPHAAWQAQYDLALQRLRSQDLAGAEQAAREALDVARAARGNTRPYEASSLNALGLIRQAQGHGEEAVALLSQALDISDRALGVHPNTASLALNLASALEGVRRPKEALPRYERALEIAGQLPADDAAAAVIRRKALSELARVHASLGHAAAAERHAARLISGEPDASATVRAAALTRQAAAFDARGEFAPAKAALEQALALREADLGAMHIEVAQSLTALATLYGRHGQPAAAEPLHRRALSIRDAIDPQDPGIAEDLNELALGHLERKEFAQAAPLLARALALTQKHHGAQSLEAARLGAGLALAQEGLGHEGEAQTLREQSLAAYESLGDTPQALMGQAQVSNHMAGVIYRKRRFKEAEPMFLRALASMERAVGPQDTRLLPFLDNIQALHVSQGRPNLARPYARRAQELRLAAEPAK